MTYNEFKMYNDALNQAKLALNTATNEKDKQKAQAWVNKIIENFSKDTIKDMKEEDKK